MRIAAALFALVLVAVAPAEFVQDRALTSAVIAAGGGGARFHTSTLFHALAGSLAGAEFMKLRLQFGRAKVAVFSDVFEFTVNDYQVLAKTQHLDIRVAPSPDPRDPKALAAALLRDADAAGTYDVDLLLDRMLGAKMHAHVRADVERRFGADANERYRAVLLQSLLDMKRANHL